MKDLTITKQIIFLLFTYTFSATSCAETTLISTSKGKYKDYYHIQMNLKNIPFTFSSDDKGKKYNTYDHKSIASNGGQFEILIPKEHFPIKAPKCSSNIIVRMPWTNSSFSNSDDLIKKKVNVFKRLIDNKGDLTITIELNPYITVLSKKPLNLELKNCNVFFRQSNGRYIDYLGPRK